MSVSRNAAKVFTTGQVAKMVQVAPRTVSKWADSGKLPCYRIPGSQDRRIPRDALVRFLKEHGLPSFGLDHEGACRILTVCLGRSLPPLEGCAVKAVDSAFEAGILCATFVPDVVLMALSGQRASLLKMAQAMRKLDGCRKARFIAVACEDDGDHAGLLAGGFDEVLGEPLAPEAIAIALMRAVGEVLRASD